MSELREPLIRRVERAERRIRGLLVRDRCNELLSIDLSIQQLRVLMLLAVDDGSSANRLAETLGVGLTTITGIVDRLERRDLVTRRLDPRDRRIRRIELTDQGRKLLEDVEAFGRDRRQALYRQLDLRILANLAEALEAMHDALAAEAEEASQ